MRGGARPDTSRARLRGWFVGEEPDSRARGVWRDDERGGVLVKDEPVVIHCYTTPADITDADRLSRLGSFCRRMGREAHQGEVGLVIGKSAVRVILALLTFALGAALALSGSAHGRDIVEIIRRLPAF